MFGKTPTNQNPIQEEIKSRWKSGNACYNSVQNLLSSSSISKKYQNKVYSTTILPFICMSVKICLSQ